LINYVSCVEWLTWRFYCVLKKTLLSNCVAVEERKLIKLLRFLYSFTYTFLQFRRIDSLIFQDSGNFFSSCRCERSKITQRTCSPRAFAIVRSRDRERGCVRGCRRYDDKGRANGGGAGEMIKGWYALETEEERVSRRRRRGGGKHPRRKRWSCVLVVARASATVVERDCLRASMRQTGPLASARHPFTHAYSFTLSLSLSLPHLSLVVTDVTRRYILLNE